MASQQTARIYWAYLPEHTDIFSEGYIGFTKHSLKHRIKGHYRQAKSGPDTIFTRAINKYGDRIIFRELCIGTIDYCLDLERKLRNGLNIGWNICYGGNAAGMGKTLSPERRMALSIFQTGRKRSEETRRKISELQKGRKLSIETRNKLRIAHQNPVFTDEHKKNISLAKKGKRSGFAASWDHPKAIRQLWLGMECLYTKFEAGIPAMQTAPVFGTPYSHMWKIYKIFKEGWNPYRDEAYQAWLKSQTA